MSEQDQQAQGEAGVPSQTTGGGQWQQCGKHVRRLAGTGLEKSQAMEIVDVQRDVVIEEIDNVVGKFVTREHFDSEIGNIKAGQDDLKSEVNDLKAGHDALKSEVNDLKAGQDVLRSDVNDLKAGQDALKVEVNDIKSDIKAIKGMLQVMFWSLGIGIGGLFALLAAVLAALLGGFG